MNNNINITYSIDLSYTSIIKIKFAYSVEIL